MADVTYDQLTALAEPQPNDLLAVYDVANALLKKVTYSTFTTDVGEELASTFLTVADNLSDLDDASVARGNLGLGSASVLAASAVFQVANNFSEVASASTARTNIGAAASSAPTITNGLTYSGIAKSGVTAVAASDIDWSVNDSFTKAVGANTTFTFSNVPTSQACAILVRTTTSGSYTVNWPAGVLWPSGVAPAATASGVDLFAIITFDGTTFYGVQLGADFE